MSDIFLNKSKYFTDNEIKHIMPVPHASIIFKIKLTGNDFVFAILWNEGACISGKSLCVSYFSCYWFMKNMRNDAFA